MISLLTSSVHQDFHKSSFIHVYEYTKYRVSTNYIHVICYEIIIRKSDHQSILLFYHLFVLYINYSVNNTMV